MRGLRVCFVVLVLRTAMVDDFLDRLTSLVYPIRQPQTTQETVSQTSAPNAVPFPGQLRVGVRRAPGAQSQYRSVNLGTVNPLTNKDSRSVEAREARGPPAARVGHHSGASCLPPSAWHAEPSGEAGCPPGFKVRDRRAVKTVTGGSARSAPIEGVSLANVSTSPAHFLIRLIAVRKIVSDPTMTQRYSQMLRVRRLVHRTFHCRLTRLPVSVWTASDGLRKPSRRSASPTFG